MPAAAPPFRLVADPAGVAALGRDLLRAPWIALDTESNSMHAYRERICLVQFNLGGDLVLLDPLALPEDRSWVAYLKPALEAARPVKFLHGGEYDVAVLKREWGITLAGVEDSQQAALLLGLPRTGYNSLVGELLKAETPADFSRHDWARRPLEDGPLAYALADVIHLPALIDLLRLRIAQADLDEEWRIACQAVMDSAPHDSITGDPAGIWRLKGARDLTSDKQAVLVALHAWRDAAARERDLPPGRLIANDLLVALARRAATNFGMLRSMKLGRVIGDCGEQILEVIRAAKASPPPLPPPPPRREVDEAESRRETRLKDWRRTEAERRGATLQAVLPAKALDHLKRHGASDLASVPQLGPKRIRLYGERLRALCAG